MSNSAIYPYPDHWELTTLGEICSDGGGGIQTGPFGSQLHAADYVDVGIPSIMPKNISIEEISTEDIACITEGDAQRLTKYLVKEGDIVYSRRGDVEKCALITFKEDGWLCGTGCLRVRLGEHSEISPIFIHAYLSHPAIREWISRHAIGATMPNLNTSILSEVPVLIPSASEREVIQNIWHNITNKIILNRQTNQTLEQIAQSIFKSWFVDFEPVKAKIAAKQNGQNPELAAMCAISGKTEEQLKDLNEAVLQQLKTTAALFPDALVESELGEIPEGWETKNIGDVVKRLKPKKRYTKKQVAPFGKVPVYEQGADILLGYHDDEPGFISTPETPLFIFGDHTCIIHLSCEPFDISQNVIPLAGEGYPTIWVYYAIQGKQEFQEYRRHWSELIIKEVVAPSQDLAASFSQLVTTLYKQKEGMVRENKILEQARDTLLPKLLSGEINGNFNQSIEVDVA